MKKFIEMKISHTKKFFSNLNKDPKILNFSLSSDS